MMNVRHATERIPVGGPDERRLRFCYESFRTVHTVAGNFQEPQAPEIIVQQFDKYLRDCKEKNSDGEAYTTGQIRYVFEKMAEDGSLKCTLKTDENGFVQIDKIQI